MQTCKVTQPPTSATLSNHDQECQDKIIYAHLLPVISFYKFNALRRTEHTTSFLANFFNYARAV